MPLVGSVLSQARPCIPLAVGHPCSATLGPGRAVGAAARGLQRARAAGPRALKGPLWLSVLLVSSELLPQNFEKSLDLFITLFIFFSTFHFVFETVSICWKASVCPEPLRPPLPGSECFGRSWEVVMCHSRRSVCDASGGVCPFGDGWR